MKKLSPFYLLLVSLFIAFVAFYHYKVTQALIAASFDNSQPFGTIPPASGCDTNPWRRTSSMVVPRVSIVAVRAGKYVYVLGGSDRQGNYLNSIEKTMINADGSLGAWELIASQMLTPRVNFASVVSGNYLYALGGVNGSSYLRSVERAEIKAGGTLGAWQAMTSMTSERNDVVVVAINGYLYALGGLNTNNDALSSVERAVINADGSLGAWQLMSNAMSTGRYGHAAIANNNYIYVLGGYGNSILDTVEYAAILRDGSLGTWQMTASLGVPRGFLAATAAGDHLYAIGGSYTGNLSRVEGARIKSDGSLGSWQVLNSLSTERSSLGVIAADGYLYAFGGNDDRGNLLNSVEWVDVLSLGSPPDNSISIKEGSLFTNQIAVTLTISAKPGTVEMQVSNDGGFFGAQWEPCVTSKAWMITQFGNYVIPRVVYIRYKDKSGNISSTFQDDIILDVTPPVGGVTIDPLAEVSAASSAITLTLNATDDVSGVGNMLISDQINFADASWQPFQSSATWSPGNSGAVYVKFRDNANNVSKVYSASVASNTSIYLPIILQFRQ